MTQVFPVLLTAYACKQSSVSVPPESHITGVVCSPVSWCAGFPQCGAATPLSEPDPPWIRVIQLSKPRHELLLVTARRRYIYDSSATIQKCFHSVSSSFKLKMKHPSKIFNIDEQFSTLIYRKRNTCQKHPSGANTEF